MHVEGARIFNLVVLGSLMFACLGDGTIKQVKDNLSHLVHT